MVTSTWAISEAALTDAENAEAFLAGIPEFSETLHPTPGGRNWRWLFATGDGTGALVARDATGAAIAHYGLFRLPYRAGDREVVAAVASQLAVAPSYRKTPLALDLSSRLYAAARTNGIAFVTGLANRAGLLEFHKAFGFRDIGEVPVFAKPISLRSAARAALSSGALRAVSPLLRAADVAWRAMLGAAGSHGVRLDRVERFDDAMAATAVHIARRHRYHARRDSAGILNERFFGNETREYACYALTAGAGLAGFVVLRSMEMKGFRTLAIVDASFDFDDRRIARGVLSAVTAMALEADAELVAMLTNSAALGRRLRENYFMRAPESFRLVVLPRDPSLGLASSRLEDWFVTWMEHDYV